MRLKYYNKLLELIKNEDIYWRAIDCLWKHQANNFTKFEIYRNIKEIILFINISESIFGSWINIVHNIISQDQVKEFDIIKINNWRKNIVNIVKN